MLSAIDETVDTLLPDVSRFWLPRSSDASSIVSKACAMPWHSEVHENARWLEQGSTMVEMVNTDGGHQEK